jgi:hypothetical protein
MLSGRHLISAWPFRPDQPIRFEKPPRPLSVIGSPNRHAAECGTSHGDPAAGKWF